MSVNSLVSFQNKVESPFIKLTIGQYTFGHCEPFNRAKLRGMDVTFPNFLNGLSIRKVNGAINTYNIKMVYAITEFDDPNLLERVFSSVSQSRKIVLTYGDWALPQYVYKEEEAILTKVTSSVDFNNSKIEYTLTATSTALSLNTGLHDFPATRTQPSSLIKRLIQKQDYGIKKLFPGLAVTDSAKLNNFIAGDDQVVELKAQRCNVLDYINYLVSCMTFKEDSPTDDLKSSRYYWATYDDVTNQYGGAYFKVIRVSANAKYNLAYNAYEIDVGYPSGNLVSNFSISNNESWAILYNYSKQIDLPSYTYDIDKEGNVVSNYSPGISKSSRYGTTVAASRDWWSNMTQYPISATITIKGLLKPALLMSYLKINTYFYGHKHISSGLYIITKQEDVIDSSGYRTTLTLTRISGDEMG